MTRRYLPDPDALTQALARRVDTLETAADKTALDVAALGRGVATLTGQLRHLTDSTMSAADLADADQVDGQPAEQGAWQPDWVSVTDPDTAAAWLIGLQDWIDIVLPGHAVGRPAACWPLHPDVVAVLLAVQAERDVAYAGERPTPVSEWLTRWLPAAADRVETGLGGCVNDRGHRDHGHLYRVADLDLAAVAAWWTTDRDTPAPAALHLPALT